GRPIARLGSAELAAVIASYRERDEPDRAGRRPFWTVRGLALEAAFAHPRHGGNRGGWGWRLVGSAGDPQPRGFTADEAATAAPVPARVRTPATWSTNLAFRSSGRDDADVCVVGLGAAGGVIAAELAELGLRVVAIEAGPLTV